MELGDMFANILTGKWPTVCPFCHVALVVVSRDITCMINMGLVETVKLGCPHCDASVIAKKPISGELGGVNMINNECECCSKSNTEISLQGSDGIIIGQGARAYLFAEHSKGGRVTIPDVKYCYKCGAPVGREASKAKKVVTYGSKILGEYQELSNANQEYYDAIKKLTHENWLASDIEKDTRSSVKLLLKAFKETATDIQNLKTKAYSEL